MKFKRGSRFGLSYHTQLKIFATCLNYSDETEEVRQKINKLCEEIGGVHKEALLEAVTTEEPIMKISMDHFLDESWLCRLCKRFYQAFSTLL